MHDSIDSLLCRIRAEFVEMPGLTLTERQAARLWQMTHDDAQNVLHALVDAHFLTRSDSGRYCRQSVV